MTADALRIRRLLPCPPRRGARVWGDWYFGHALRRAFEDLGHDVRVSYAHNSRPKRWLDHLRRSFRRDEVALVLRGRRALRPVRGQRAAMWLISQADSLTDAELARYDHVFVASDAFHRRIAGQCKGSSVLLQCTDTRDFHPATGPRSGRALFVGNRRANAPRPVVEAALSSGCPLEVWGQGWKGVLPDAVFGGTHIENSELAGHYSAASLVLNDHTDDMRRNGFVSNRIYDVLACGTPILTEDMDGIPDDLRPHLTLYRDRDEAARKIAAVLATGETEADRRRSVAELVRRAHGFDRRARDILAVLRQLATAPAPLSMESTT